MKKIKIAQIGLNEYSHSLEIFQSLEKQGDIFEIVGYALPENEENRLPNKAKYLQKKILMMYLFVIKKQMK